MKKSLARKEGGIAGKTFADYWKVIQLPVIVLVVWAVIQTAVQMAAPMMGWGVGAIGMLISLIALLYVGWSGVKNYKLDLAQSAVAGALTAVIAGVVALILAVLAFAAVGTAVAGAAGMMGYGAGYGVPAAAMGGFVIGALIIGRIFGLIVGAIVGAILAAIGAVVAQNVK